MNQLQSSKVQRHPFGIRHSKYGISNSRFNTYMYFNILGLGEDECKRSSLGYEYTGKVSVTESNRTCQAWNSQTPHEHKDFTNLPENYCRNPDGEPAPWCYTEDPKKRWEICNIPYCGKHLTVSVSCINNWFSVSSMLKSK